MTIETIIEAMIKDRISVLINLKAQLEIQLTGNTGNDIDLPVAFAEQRKEKLLATIKELKLLENETIKEN